MIRARRGVLVAVVLALAGCTAPPTPEPLPEVSASGVATSAASPSATAAQPSVPSTIPSTAPSTVPSTGPSTAPEPATDPTTPATCGWQPCYTAPVDDGTLPDAVGEASGIAAAGTDPDLFFVVDDGTGVDAIEAVRLDGSPVAAIDVDGMSASNAEALTAGLCEAGSPDRCLYVGDIGGNAGRPDVTVYRLPEPHAPLPASVRADAWTYAYPDGSYNAEAMLVTDDGSIVVITKPDRGTLPHRVYVGPPGGGDLVLHSMFRPPDPLTPARSFLVGNVVTDAARSPGAVLLLTYDQAVEYRAPTPDADPADFADWPWRQVPTPDQWQSEGIAYRSAGCGYVVISEGSPFGGAAIGSVGCV